MDECEGEEPYCPYCKKSLSWDQFKELWVCRDHGKFDTSEVIYERKDVERKIYTFMYIFSCDEDEDPKDILNQELYEIVVKGNGDVASFGEFTVM
jgi:hypothetical protein